VSATEHGRSLFIKIQVFWKYSDAMTPDPQPGQHWASHDILVGLSHASGSVVRRNKPYRM
jgi:hypothetical protein